MRERGFYTVPIVRVEADDKTDGVLVNAYHESDQSSYLQTKGKTAVKQLAENNFNS